MPQTSKTTTEERIKAVEDYLSGKRGYSQILRELKITPPTMRRWVFQYKNRGAAGLIPATRQKRYALELKNKVVQEYYETGCSLEDLCVKYDITKPSIVHIWIKRYNSHGEFKDRQDGGCSYMVKGRKTSIDERIEIVQFCIAKGRNYNQASDKYQVSYQQIYGWVKKYEKLGVQGLEDHRGKGKSENAMTEDDKLRAENKILSAKLKQAEIENDLLKKVWEAERGRH